MFVLVQRRQRRERPRGRHQRHRGGGRACKEPWYNYHVGTLVHASRQLGVYTSAPTLFLANDHTGHTELCSLFLDQAFRQGKNGVLLAKCRLLFIAEFAAAVREQGHRRAARPPRRRRPQPVLGRPRTPLLRDGVLDRGLPDRHRPEVVHRRADAQASGVREPAAAASARRDRRGARGHRAGAHDARAGRLSLRRLRRHLRRGPDARVLSRQHPRGAPVAGDAGDARRGGPGARQPDRRHPVARLQPAASRIFARSSSRRPRAPIAFRCCRMPPMRCASAKATACARCRWRRRTDERRSRRVQLRRHPRADAQLLGPRARQPRLRAQREPGRQSARRPRCRDSPRCARSRSAACRRPCCRRTSVRRCGALRALGFAGSDADGARASGARRAGAARPRARRPRRCGSPMRRPSARRRTRRTAACTSRRPISPRISIARSKRRRRPRSCARSSRMHRASPCTMRCRRRRRPATKALPITRAWLASRQRRVLRVRPPRLRPGTGARADFPPGRRSRPPLAVARRHGLVRNASSRSRTPRRSTRACSTTT